MSIFSFEGYGIGFAAVAIPDMKNEIRSAFFIRNL